MHRFDSPLLIKQIFHQLPFREFVKALLSFRSDRHGFIYICGMPKAPTKQELISYLNGFVTERRQQRFHDVLSERTGHLRIVLEDVYQAHNASAVLRSCDCFGVQYVDFIENRNRYKISEEVALGSSNWLSISRHNSTDKNNTIDCFNKLKAEGYKIVATTPHKDDYNIYDLPVDQKIALLFGTEIDGITKDVFDHADAFVKIPMYGFTESFNISVCAALCMYELTTRIRKSGIDYHLSEEEKTDIYLEWQKNSISSSDLIIKEFLEK
jgi:tRNA (guanosine-2'-O-)-methyltransferase